VRIEDGDVRFGATSARAEGLIHGTNSDLNVNLSSTDLTDVSFLYKDANGVGSFDGVLTGPIKTPRLEGSFSLQDHVYRSRKIERAAGNVRLDTEAETVDLVDVTVAQGQSAVTISGNASLDGSAVDFRIATARVLGSDIAQLINRNLAGSFSGNIQVSSLDPIKLEGDVRADRLTFENKLVGDVRSHLRYVSPVIELSRLSARNGQASLDGDVTFNHENRTVDSTFRLSSIDLDLFRPMGLPESLGGVVRQARFRAQGTTARPDIEGEASIQNLVFFGEVFPEARIQVTSSNTTLKLALETSRNLNLMAEVDIARTGYPFNSNASFVEYPLERLAKLSEGTLAVTGNATITGLLTDTSTLRGQGRIESASAVIQQRTLSPTQPFTFDFTSDRLAVSNLTISGGATEIRIAGTIGFSEREPLNLDVSGRVDLGLLVAASPEWTSSGSLSLDGRVGGTIQTPDLRGVARFDAASFARRGIFTTLSDVNGDLFFDQNRVTLNNLQGRVGGGTVTVQGTALLRDQGVADMNIRIESNDVRIRYPEGLRTVVDGSMILRGGQMSPLLEGNLRIESMSYGASFEEFLQLIQQTDGGFRGEETLLDRLRLALHVEGNRNISIQNQVADIEARVDLDVRGTAANPALTGHVEASGGTLNFQGTRYEVTRGNVDFVDPLRIEPVVDIQAETELRDYRVILAISGRGDRLRLDLRSDPPLPQLEIVSLVAGGPTREEFASDPGAGDVPTSEQLFQRGAGSILFDLLQSRVGGRMGLLGLDRVRIDPFLSGAGNDPGARITISERVTKDLAITYSQDLSSNRQQVIIIEYFVTKDTSVVASRDETGALGLDLKFRHRF
jgi:translocation and assembly module TamB